MAYHSYVRKKILAYLYLLVGVLFIGGTLILILGLVGIVELLREITTGISGETLIQHMAFVAIALSIGILFILPFYYTVLRKPSRSKMEDVNQTRIDESYKPEFLPKICPVCFCPNKSDSKMCTDCGSLFQETETPSSESHPLIKTNSGKKDTL